jgi:hypothetical protein
MSDQTNLPSLDQDEAPGDSADQAQRLQMAEEQDAIAAALRGAPEPEGSYLEGDTLAELKADDED